MAENPSTTLFGTVEKIIKPRVPSEPERAQTAVEGADHLYKELRIENALTDASGNRVYLKPGAKVQITVEAEPQGVITRIHYKVCRQKWAPSGLNLWVPSSRQILVVETDVEQ